MTARIDLIDFGSPCGLDRGPALNFYSLAVDILFILLFLVVNVREVELAGRARVYAADVEAADAGHDRSRLAARADADEL